jgi:hypothetical protein
MDVDWLAVFHYFYDNVAFQLIIKLFRLVVMIVLARVRSTNNHNDKVASFFVQVFIADWWF